MKSMVKVKRCQPINSFESTVTALLVGIIWVHQCREDCQKTHMKQLIKYYVLKQFTFTVTVASYSVCFYAWHVDDDVVKMIIKLSW